MSDLEVRARDARAMLDNPLFNEAIAELKAAAVTAWLSTGSVQTEAREFAWATAKTVERLEAYFQQIADDGRFEASRAIRKPMP